MFACFKFFVPGNLIYLSEDIYEAEGVRTLLEPLKVESKISKLKGVRQDLRLFCIAADLSPHLPSVESEAIPHRARTSSSSRARGSADRARACEMAK